MVPTCHMVGHPATLPLKETQLEPSMRLRLGGFGGDSAAANVVSTGISKRKTVSKVKYFYKCISEKPDDSNAHFEFS